MRLRGILAAILSTLQVAIGALTAIFACVLYFDFFDVQTMLNARAELLPFYLFALMVFSFFSIMSGLLLFHEARESH